MGRPEAGLAALRLPPDLKWKPNNLSRLRNFLMSSRHSVPARAVRGLSGKFFRTTAPPVQIAAAISAHHKGLLADLEKGVADKLDASPFRRNLQQRLDSPYPFWIFWLSPQTADGSLKTRQVHAIF